MSSTAATPLDCGPIGWAVENHGPSTNRVNYAILGDGYLAADLVGGGVFEQHINAAMAKRFTAIIGQPYARYRNFVNICAIKVVSTGAICGSSALGCCGSDSSRLANCNATSASTAFSQNLPASFMMDWRAIMLNGSSWWNTGAALMLWSGGNKDAGAAALHEGGHGFHALNDEYGDCTGACGMNTNGTGTAGSAGGQVNMCGDPTTTDNKWTMWLGYDQTGATGIQGTWTGAGSNRYKPSQNSMMNSLFGTNPNTSFNSVSREKMVMDIWQRVVPIDSTVPPAGAVAGAMPLKVNVIDPAVIDVDWSVDGAVVAAKGGTTFDVAARGLAAGSHTISAKAYDNAGMDLVRQVPGTTFGRQYWARSVQTVTWTVAIP